MAVLHSGSTTQLSLRASSKNQIRTSHEASSPNYSLTWRAEEAAVARADRELRRNGLRIRARLEVVWWS
ncbi:hypothetical protein M0R45_028395 [Rubus argutus]|uniref:Uncharacterized protein n=1 Tax=Rubus argutus TaxID=59490 RepID=A0AAW1W7A1_RUBAR